jgi:hypothetical protein
MLYPTVCDEDNLPSSKTEPEAFGLILHRDGLVLDLSDETAAMFGCTRDQLIGWPVAKLVITDGDGSFEPTLVTALGEHRAIEIISGCRSR